MRCSVGAVIVLMAARSFGEVGEVAPIRLDHDQVVRLASKNSPAVVVARSRVEETRGAVAGARVLSRDNPVIEMRAGPRLRPNERLLDVDLALDIPVELYGQRGLRVEAARQSVIRDQIGAADVARRTIAESLSRYYRVLHAEAALTWARARFKLATELAHVAKRRRAAGEVGDLDVRVVELELARARRVALLSASESAIALAELRKILGLPEGARLELAAKLEEAVRRFGKPLLAQSVAQRPDSAAAEAAVVTGRADLAHEKRLRWPVPVVRLAYEREEGANILLAGLALPLPLFQRNQGAVAETRARVARLEAERDYLQRRIGTEVASARQRYAAALEALGLFEETAIRLLDENLRLSQRAYEVGQKQLTDLLIIRREALETRREHLDTLLEVALAGIELQAALGRLP